MRSSGLAILYALGVTIFGGTTQFIVAWLIDWTKDPMVPAWYQIVANVASIVGVMLLMPHADVARERAARTASPGLRAGPLSGPAKAGHYVWGRAAQCALSIEYQREFAGAAAFTFAGTGNTRYGLLVSTS